MALVARRLRCNLLADPLAVAEGAPKLSWVVEGEGQAQSAYQIEVQGRWDSGKVKSDATYAVPYGGKPVAPRQKAVWRVRVWDERDQAGPWSEWARWTAAPSEWSADWIGFDEPLNANRLPDFMGAHWVWHADGPLNPVPECVVVFRKTFALDRAPESIVLLGTGDDTFSATLNGNLVGQSDGRPDSWRRPVMVDMAEAAMPGENVLEITVESHATTASAMIAKILVADGGQRREIVTGAGWEARFTDSNDWKPVRSLGEHGIPPWGGVNVPELFLPPPRVLRRAFDVPKAVKRAMLYATAQGIYQASINGARIGDDWFAPGWTDYKKRLHYRAYDVTAQIAQGGNSIEAVLGDGWFSGYVGFGKRHHYGEQTRFSAMLWLDFEDGTSQLVSTDEAWRAGTGPCSMSDFLMGEEFDAQDTRTEWHPVVMGSQLTPKLEPYPMQPVVTFEELPALSVSKAPNGTWVYDLGQNFAGVCRLRVSSDNGGERYVLRHGEILDKDSSVYTTNLRSARARDVYVTKKGAQTWAPTGTFHGFRYVEVAGPDSQPPADLVTGLALSNVKEAAAGFECSDPRLNQLWSNIDWTFRSNFIEVPTDCPQRDERLGWTGDIQVFVHTAAILADVQPFLRKWLVDLADSQEPNGNLPKIAPVVYDLNDGGPAWADAGTIVPWALWEVYEDREALAQNYDMMRRFVDFCTSRLTSDGLPPAQFHCFGDWLNVNVNTPNPVLFMLFLGRSSWIVGEAAAVLGKAEDARKYRELFRRTAMRFRATYLSEDGWIQGKSQTAQVLALAFKMVEGPAAQAVFDRLAEDIEERGHLTTGFIGTKDLLLVLRDFGRVDLAYRLLLSDEYPGWLFSIKHGATSIWERWNGWTPDQGFGDPGMNSFAHYAFGAVGQFMMETIGGIRTLEPGYRRIQVSVERGPLEWADCWYDSPRGRIAVSWKGDSMRLTVPPNVEAVVKTADQDVNVKAGRHTFRI